MSARDKATLAWNGLMPDWVAALALECDRTSQTKAGQRIGISPSVVNQVLANKYGGTLHNVERKVRNELMEASVFCPFFQATMARKKCDVYRARKLSTHSPQAFQLWQACQTCPENNKEPKNAKQ